MSDESGTKAPAKSPVEIQADIAESQRRLASTVDELVGRTRPKALLDSAVETGRERLNDELYDETGNLRTRKIAMVGGAAAGVLAALITLRVLLSKRRG